MNDTKVIELARELGHAIQDDQRYKDYVAAKLANDENAVLQDLIGQFNLKRISINAEMGRKDKDEEKLKRLNQEMRDVYDKIMADETMMEYNRAKSEMESLINYVSTIINMSANGEDPDTAEPSACTGSCESCSGCH